MVIPLGKFLPCDIDHDCRQTYPKKELTEYEYDRETDELTVVFPKDTMARFFEIRREDVE